MPPSDSEGRDGCTRILYAAQVREAAVARAEYLAAQRADPEADEEALYEGRAWERESKDSDQDAELVKSEHDAYLEVAKGSIERGQTGAEFIRNAAAAIGTLYTGLLGVTFAAADGARALPTRGVIPAFFLAFALVLASAYAAVLRPGTATVVSARGDDLASIQAARLDAFVHWTSEVASRNAYALHAALYALGVGVAFLPAPFIDWDGSAPWVLAGAAFVTTLILARLTSRRVHRSNRAAAEGRGTR
jgi:hypothetical protein